MAWEWWGAPRALQGHQHPHFLWLTSLWVCALCPVPTPGNDQFQGPFLAVLILNTLGITGLFFAWPFPKLFPLLSSFTKIQLRRHLPFGAVKGGLFLSICFPLPPWSISPLRSIAFNHHVLNTSERMCQGPADALMYG